MKGNISLIGNYGSDWIRYSDYEFKEASDGDVYITPAGEASYTMYNPFNVAEDLIIDLINIGDLALKLEKNEDKNERKELIKEILLFTRKYGLIGLICASVYNRDIIGDDIVLLIENNIITGEKMMEESKYVEQFIPFVEKGDVEFRRYKNNVDVVKREDSPKYHGKRPVVLDLVFSKFYTEKLNWIIDFAKLISSHFNQLLIYKNTTGQLTENVTIMAGKFHPHKIGFTIDQLDETNISWDFDSLKTTIETIYAFAVTDETTRMDRCKHCNSVYIASNVRTKYCSSSCRNLANVQKSRERKKG